MGNNYIEPNWVRDSIFYQIFPERFYNGDFDNDPPNKVSWTDMPNRNNFFGGDLQGIIQSLDYLQDLGINAIYLTPIFQAETNHKYDTTDYFKIDPHFGDMKIFSCLIKEVHRRKMKVILDGVFNHSGDHHWAFLDAIQKGPASPYWKWYNFYGFPIRKHFRTNYETGGIYYLPKWNIKNPQVRKYLFRVIRYWTERGIDGWRLDLPSSIDHEFWQDFRILVKGINPEAYLVGEIWGDASAWLQGDEFDGVMNYQIREIILQFFVEKTITADAFDKHLNSMNQNYPPVTQEAMLNLLGSHDTPRIFTLCKGNKEKVKLCIIFLMTYTGAPMIYYGDEVGLRGGNDPGCRKCMPWNIDFQNNEIYKFYQRCIKIRKQHSALRKGSFQTLFAEREIYSFIRKREEETIIIIMNSNSHSEEICINLSEKGIKGNQFLDLLDGRKYSSQKGKIRILLPKTSGVILVNNYIKS